MASEIVESSGAFFVLWGKPGKVDIARVFERLRAAAVRNGGPVVYITRVPEGAPPPDAQTRRYVNEVMPRIVECCSSYHVVMEGDGFVAAVKRGILVSMFQIGQRRGLFHVHASVDDIARYLDSEKEPTVRALLSRARAQGLLDGNPLASLVPAAKQNLRQTG